MAASKGGELPSGYARCSFLESTGQQYCELDYNYNAAHTLFGKVLTKTGGTTMYLGSYNSAKNTLVFGCFNGKYLVWYNSSREYDISTVPFTSSNEVEFEISPTKWKVTSGINTYEKNITLKPEIITINPFPLFKAYGYNASPDVKFYSFVVKDGDGNVIVNAVPSLDPQGKPCMFDTVSGQAFYNQGTGEFLYELA